MVTHNRLDDFDQKPDPEKQPQLASWQLPFTEKAGKFSIARAGSSA